MRRIAILMFFAGWMGLTGWGTERAYGHCQIPCGIYDDHARVEGMLEDAKTAQKAAGMIGELAGRADAQSRQQLVRWVNNKEIHAERIIRTISDYFLTQRVKPSQKDYQERLQKHHAVMLAAMKAKQNADVQFGRKLSDAIDKLKAYYPSRGN